MSDFQWTQRRERAAALLADDQLSDAEIAAQVGITRQALTKWKQAPSFQARIDSIVAATRQRLRSHGIREKVNRISALADRHERLCQVIEARATDPLMAAVPGGRTGMLVAEPMLVKVYEAGYSADEDAERIDGPMSPSKTSRVLYKYAVDTGLLKELREIEKHIAQELNQWSEGKATMDIHILIERIAEEQGWSEDEKLMAVEESRRALRLLKSANA